jgi:hypothetical protein
VQARDADSNPRLSGGDAIRAYLRGPVPAPAQQLPDVQQPASEDAGPWEAHGPVHEAAASRTPTALEDWKQLVPHGYTWREEAVGEVEAVEVEVEDRGDGSYGLAGCRTAAGSYQLHVDVGTC